MMRIWREDRRQLPFDSARARRILADQGWTDGNQDGVLERNGRELRFDLLYPGSSRVREQAAVIIQAQLGSLGIDVRLVSVEFNVWLARMDEGRFDASLGAWLVDAPPSGMRQFWTSDGIGVSNHGWYQSAVFDSLFRLAVAADDPVEAAEIWDNAISVINEDAPAIWLFTPTMVAGVNRRFGNVTIRPDLWAATLWRWTVN